MLKFIEKDTQVVLREVPDEISLTINFTNCPHRCPGCHSPYLREDIGEFLTKKKLDELIDKNEGISCVCFFGGDNNHEELWGYFLRVSERGLKVAWYSGDDSVDIALAHMVDYYKVGPYIEALGPLDKETTNQRLFKVHTLEDGRVDLEDITNKFWKQW